MKDRQPRQPHALGSTAREHFQRGSDPARARLSPIPPVGGQRQGADRSRGVEHSEVALVRATPGSRERDDPLEGLDAPVRPPWGKRQVLLLNATFEPLTALPVKRAVVLMVCGKAEVVHDDPSGLALHSATAQLTVPSVIRLSRYVRVPYRAKVPLTRAGVMYRDRYRCVYCALRAETIDHVIPRSRGGGHSWQNCVASCAKCNHRKADKLLSELGWTLPTTPAAPSGPHWRLLAGVGNADPLWLQYLGEPAA